jgi:hypothetical protein
MKINDRVKIINRDSVFYGLVGKIIDRSGYTNYLTAVKFNNGMSDSFEEEDLQPVKPSFDTLLVGDIIDDGDNEAKVLEVGATSFLISFWADFNGADCWVTFEEAKAKGWKVKGQEEEDEEDEINAHKIAGREGAIKALKQFKQALDWLAEEGDE